MPLNEPAHPYAAHLELNNALGRVTASTHFPPMQKASCSAPAALHDARLRVNEALDYQHYDLKHQTLARTETRHAARGLARAAPGCT